MTKLKEITYPVQRFTNGEYTLERSQSKDFQWNLYCERTGTLIDSGKSRTEILNRNNLSIQQ